MKKLFLIFTGFSFLFVSYLVVIDDSFLRKEDDGMTKITNEEFNYYIDLKEKELHGLYLTKEQFNKINQLIDKSTSQTNDCLNLK